MTSPKFPKSLAACADQYYQLREARLAKEKEAEAIKEQETAFKEHLINNLQKDTTGVAGKLCRVQVTVKPEPQVDDWGAFYEYIRKHKAFELLQRRINTTAIRERWADHVVVAGIGTFQKVDLSLSKVK